MVFFHTDLRCAVLRVFFCFFLVFIIPFSVYGLECFDKYSGFQRFVPNSQGLVFPPEIGRNDLQTGAVPPDSPILNPVYFDPLSPQQRENVENTATGVQRNIIFPDNIRFPSERGFFNTQKVLRFGYIDDEVKELQRCLAVFGFPISFFGAGSIGNETTYFGRGTELSLKRFQRHVRLDDTGVLDDTTRFYLEFPQAVDITNEVFFLRQQIVKLREAIRIRIEINEILEEIRVRQLRETGRLRDE